MTLILGISTAIGILIYLLHRQGFAVTKSIAAVLFVISTGKKRRPRLPELLHRLGPA